MLCSWSTCCSRLNGSDGGDRWLQMEIDTLRAELAGKRRNLFQLSEGAEISQIQDELSNAVAQSFELQMELEQTHARMKEMEDMLSREPEGSLDEFMAKANQAEQEAQQRIDELTNAPAPEQLRAETEDLLTEMERNAKAGGQIFPKIPLPCLAAGNGWSAKRLDCCPANARPAGYPTGGCLGSQSKML